MTTKLKPCPFCGRSATTRGDFGLEQLACSDPSGECPASDFGIPAHTPQRRASAIEAWNRRAQPPAQAEAVPPGFVAFARDVLADFPHSYPDEFDLNDLAIKYGLLIGKTVTERCGELCNCAEYHGEDELKGGVTCYHRHAAMAQGEKP